MAAATMLLLTGVLALLPAVLATPNQVAAYASSPAYTPTPAYPSSPSYPLGPSYAPAYPSHIHGTPPPTLPAVTPRSDLPPAMYPPAYVPYTPAPKTVYDVLASNTDRLGVFKTIVDNLRLEEFFKKDNTTVFIPSNMALQALLSDLNIDPSQLSSSYGSQALALVMYHQVDTPISFGGKGAIEERYSTAWGNAEVGRGVTVKRAQTIDDKNVTAWKNSVKGVFGGEAKVLEADIPAGTSYVHIIDSTLRYWYPSIWEAITESYLASNLSSLRAAVVSAKLDFLLRQRNLNYSLLAVNNDAFASTGRTMQINASALARPRDQETLVRYHLLRQPWDGESDLSAASVATLESGLNLTYANHTLTSYGNTRGFVGEGAVAVGIVSSRSWVLPVRGEVLLPINVTAFGLMTNTPDLSLLVSLLNAEQNITRFLKNASASCTVFAPSNAAMQALATRYNTTLDRLNATTLNRVLSLHVVPGVGYNSEDVEKTIQATTLAGIQIAIANSTVTVAADSQSTAQQTNKAKIIVPGLNATYGRSYVHIVDSVLMPIDSMSLSTSSSSSIAPAASLSLVSLFTALALFLVRWP